MTTPTRPTPTALVESITPEPPTTAELITTAQVMLGITWEDCERLPLIALRRFWSCQQRHNREVAEAFDAGFRSAGGTIVIDPT